jgi:hypothetical protein
VNTTSTQSGPSQAPNPTGNTGTPSPAPEQGSTGAVADVVIGGVVALATLGVAIFCYLRKKRRSSIETRGPTYLSSPVGLYLNPTTREQLPIKVD